MENWLVKLLSGCRGMLILLDGVDIHEPNLLTDPEYVIFCQRRGPAGSELEPLAWRYVVSSMDEPPTVFDTIPKFLAMYNRYRGCHVSDASEFDEVEVLQAMWNNYGSILVVRL